MNALEPLIRHHASGGVFIKETAIPAGMVLVQHKHNYDHLAYLAAGRVVVRVDDADREVSAPACLNIVAGKHHGVKALVDSLWLCVHSLQDSEFADEVLIAEDSDTKTMLDVAEALV